jgi:hypothetical protein
VCVCDQHGGENTTQLGGSQPLSVQAAGTGMHAVARVANEGLSACFTHMQGVPGCCHPLCRHLRQQVRLAAHRWRPARWPRPCCRCQRRRRLVMRQQQHRRRQPAAAQAVVCGPRGS